MKRQRTLGFRPVSKKVRFFVTMPLTSVLSQCKINIKSWNFPGASPPNPPIRASPGFAPDVDRLAVLYAASLAAKMYDTSAKLTVLVEKNIWGYKKIKSSRGGLKPIRAQKAY